jgi:NAD(P)-dependent dehydrogenase (short-subunit alcohol dehydrogenase family)
MPAPVIIVTEVSRGIGRAIAEELQSRGAAVVGAARNVADVPATARLLECDHALPGPRIGPGQDPGQRHQPRSGRNRGPARRWHFRQRFPKAD